MNAVHERMLEHFSYAHLPEHLQERSARFARLAQELVEDAPQGRDDAELTVALRKLLEAKDAAVRAVLRAYR